MRDMHEKIVGLAVSMAKQMAMLMPDENHAVLLAVGTLVAMLRGCGFSMERIRSMTIDDVGKTAGAGIRPSEVVH